MKYDQLVSLSENLRQDEKHLIRLYIFASPALLEPGELDAFRRLLCQKLFLNESQFLQALARQSQHMESALDKTRRIFEESDYLEDFRKRHHTAFARAGLKEEDASRLMVRMLNMVLLQMSRTLFQNHLRKRDALLVLEMLENEKRLKPLIPYIEKPFTMAAKKGFSFSSAQFLFRSLAVVQCLSDYCIAYLKDGPGARMALTAQQLRQFHKWDLSDIQGFLYSETETNPGT